MTAITITDLNNAKTDVGTIDAFANSTDLTTTTRMGDEVPTRAGLTAMFPFAEAAALAATRIYGTTSAGLAATTSGQYFFVPSTDDIESLILYQNNAGVAGEVKRYLSAHAVEVTVGSKVTHAFVDEGDNVLAALMDDGGLQLVGMDQTVQEATKNAAEAGSPTEFAHVFQDDDGRALAAIAADGNFHVARAGSVQDAFAGRELVTGLEYQAQGDDNAARLYFDMAKHKYATPLRIEAVACGFNQDTDVVACRFIQPLVLTDSTGLVIFTQKNKNFTGGSENAQRVVVKDYTIDLDAGTVAFSATRVINQPALWTSGKGYASEPYALKLTQGPNAGRIILMYRVNENVDQTLTAPIYNLYFRTSDDGGQTWSAASLAVTNDGTNMASAGQMLELSSGRLVYPIYRLSSPHTLGAIISDDHGATWARSSVVADSSRTWSEPSLIQRADGSLLMLVRSDTNNNLLERGIFTSNDEGSSWAFEGISTQAAFTNSNTALINTASAMGFPRVIAASSAQAAFYKRTQYRVRISYDEGVTFNGVWSPFADRQGTGYSHIARINATTMVLGFETFSSLGTWPGDGDINQQNSVHVLIFNLPEVFAHVDSVSL